jgi:ceramide glucosyltransferase
MTLIFSLFPWFLFLGCLAAMGFYAVAIYSVITFFRSNRPINPDFYPSVTILKPLYGFDSETRTNLLSFCYQDYPSYQIVFSVREASDPVIAVVRQIIEELPGLDLELVICDRLIGNNLKVSNLANAFKAAKYELIILADSDIRVGEDYLRRLVQPFQQETVGVVTCLYNAHALGKWAIFESLGISSQFQPNIFVARLVEGVHFAFGSTIAIRRSVLEAIGGFSAIADDLADDYQLGHLPTLLGYETVLSEYVVEHQMTATTLSEFWQRQARWMRCIRVERFWSYLGLIFTQGTPLSLLFLILTGGSAWGWVTLALTWGLRLIMAWIVAVQYLQDKLVRRYFWLLPLRDLVYFAIWCYSIRNNHIEWRGQSFQLTTDGKLINEKPINA